MKIRHVLLSAALLSTLSLSGLANAQTVCLSATSDPDGDGYGWENNQSCVVVSGASGQGVCEDHGSFPWGWNPSSRTSCRLDSPSIPDSSSSSCIDTDGDGYGWDGSQTCLVGTAAEENQSNAVVVTTQSVSPQPTSPQVTNSPLVQPVSPQTTERRPEAVNLAGSLPYPDRSGFDIKSLGTDFWLNKQELLDANISGVAVNLVWANWQPTLKSSCSSSEINFDGQCFTINPAFDQQIKFWSGQGKTVTGVIYGTPSWARDNSICRAETAGTEIFCAARDANDYARFTAMIAERYNGLNGNGRIADFVIHNEVNMNQWYKVGCGNGVACNQENWISDYAQNFNAAYDRITAIQPAAKVMVPFAHHFDTSFDNPAGSDPIISVKTFIRGVHARAGGRKWRIAYHPYHRRLDSAEASFNDLPQVTFGNIGVLAGWLRQQFPSQPESWEIHLTENGVSSSGQSDENSQNVAVCNSYRNVLGTPGIENYVYHRMQDHPLESIAGASFGLRREDGSAKPVWSTWSSMSGRGGQRNNLNCGFENLPYTRLTSNVDNRGNYRASSRVVGSGFNLVSDWYLLRAYQSDTHMAFECGSESSSYISTDVNCSGSLSYGPVGYVHKSGAADRVGLYTCSNGSQTYSSDVANCGGERVVEFVGYVKTDR